jgi:hypothetical protein
MRVAFVEGLKAGAVTAPRKSRFARWGLASALVASAAFAQLVVFQPDTPALASSVNGNFTQLKTWLEAKVGSVATTGVTTSSVTTTTATVNGQLTAVNYFPALTSYNALNPSGSTASIVNDNVGYQALMLVGNNSAGGTRRVNVYDDLLVSGNLTINGSGGNTPHACKVRTANSNNVASCGGGEVALGGGAICPFPGNSYQFASSIPWNVGAGAAPGNGGQATGWRTDCLVWGGANTHVVPDIAYVTCCVQ